MPNKYRVSNLRRGLPLSQASVSYHTSDELGDWMERDENFANHLADTGYGDEIDFAERLDLYAEFVSDKEGGHLTIDPPTEYRI